MSTTGLFETAARESLSAQKEKCRRPDRADEEDHNVIGNEIWKDHQSQAAQHDLPETHSFAVNECDESDRAKHQTANEICCIELEHVDLSS
jgi:hypothetical protein